MSPEQARGETDLDPRSDVWALCVLAYECLVGKPPFHGDNYNALLWAIIHDEPVPITVYQAGDSELWRLLKTGFAKDRTGRWDSAKKLGEALARWLENQGVVEDVCNRSLHASWLPAERPTRPELAPFEELAPPPLRAQVSSHSEPAPPPPTLPALRKPNPMSLWFAGLGLLTLLGAILLSDDGAEDGTDTDVEALTPKKELPGPVAHTDPTEGQEPIGTPPAKPKNSWTEGHKDPPSIEVDELDVAVDDEPKASEVTPPPQGSATQNAARRALSGKKPQRQVRTRRPKPRSKPKPRPKDDFDFGI
jgi:serine/threonine protein kinase